MRFSYLTIPIQGARVLDIGGGQGRFRSIWPNKGAHCTVRSCAEMLDFAVDYFAQEQQNLPEAQCCTLQEVQAPIFPQQFDVVLNHAVLGGSRPSGRTALF